MQYKWNIIGHENQLEMLERDIAEDNIAHAYLFSGSAGLGKNIIARTFAQILQCPNNFCRHCAHCIQIENKAHFDTIFFSDSEESIKIEQIRDLIQSLSLTVQARYKIVILENAERMTLEASNSLLKILEEPNPRTIFLLTVCSLAKIPSTVLSRTRQIKFYPLTSDKLVESLIRLYSEMNVNLIHTAVAFSAGLPVRALEFIKNEDLLSQYQKYYEIITSFLDDKLIYPRFEFIEEIQKTRNSIDIFLEMLLYILRKKILESIYSDNDNIDRFKFLLEDAERSRKLIHNNVNSRLVLENLVLNFSLP